MNQRFQNALKRTPQKIPPIWFMRQAGRYHTHYQKLRAEHSFMDLCKIPELASEVALGPIQDFDFDVAILFSDLLFPLEAMGMGLEYTDSGPKLGWHLRSQVDVAKLRPPEVAIADLQFQFTATKLTRERLPSDKSLIGFVGGPWTLFTYAVQGSHDGSLVEAKKHIALFKEFCDVLRPLLIANIDLQLRAGAEVVMLFDTAAGELPPYLFQNIVLGELNAFARRFPGRLGYYSKGTHAAHLAGIAGEFAGLGVDHRWALKSAFGLSPNGFVQGNFDQALLHLAPDDFKTALKLYLKKAAHFSETERAGWVAGLSHGVLPKTPESNVRHYVEAVREHYARA